MRFLIALLAYATIAAAQPDSLRVIWDKRGYGDGSHFGGGVFALGDQNNDGYADFAVLSTSEGLPGADNEPRLDLFHGGNPPDTIPCMTFKGSASESRYFYGGRTIGDLNGDGYVDWWTDNYTIGDSLMRVWIFFGGPNADTIPDVVFHYDPASGRSWMRPIGDINGDNHDDFFFYCGATGHDETYFYFGGAVFDTIPDFVIHSTAGRQTALPIAHGEISGDHRCDFITSHYVGPSTLYFYWGGAPPDTNPAIIWNDFYVGWPPSILDINGNGFGDLLIPRSNRVDVHLGGPAIASAPDFVLLFSGCEYGPQEVDDAGDFNGDGIGDVAVISRDCNSALGAVKLYLGCPWPNAAPSLSIDGDSEPLYLVGIRHAIGIGDVDADGVQDWAIGATNDMTYGQGRRGRVVILRGDTTLHVDAREPRASIPRSLDVTVSPNPFNGEATILLNVPLFTPQVKLMLYNLLGQTVHEAILQGVSGQTRYSLSVPFLPSGVYLLSVQSGPLFSTQKIMLLR